MHEFPYEKILVAIIFLFLTVTILKVNYIFQHERGLILCITRTSQKRLSATQKQQLGALPYSIQD